MVGYALVAVAASAWGTWPLILRRAPMQSSLEAAIVMLVLTVGAGPLILRDRVKAKATLRQWLGVAWLGLSDAGNIALFFAAYHRTSVAIAVLTHYLTPIFVAIAAPFVIAEKATARTYAAVGVAFSGLVLLLEPWRTAVGGLVGAALGTGSAVFYASNVLTNKRLAKAFSGSELMFFHGVVATPLLFARVPLEAYTEPPASAWAWVLLGAVGPGTMAGLFFVWGLRRVPASHASTLTLLEPFVAVVAAAAFLGERVGPLGIFGGVLILVGALAVIGGRDEEKGGADPS